MKRLLFLFIFVFISSGTSADTIRLKNGTTLKGQLLKSDGKYIRINVEGGVIVSFDMNEVTGFDPEDSSLDINDIIPPELLEGIEAPGTGLGSKPGIDSDGDGLYDEYEKKTGSNPNNPDTDGDGLSDYDEFRYRTDPLKTDTDGNGVSDKEEVEKGTDPAKAENKRKPEDNSDKSRKYDAYKKIQKSGLPDSDTDGDGLKDADEVLYCLDPLNPDTNKDGVSDKEEVEKRKKENKEQKE